MYESKRIKIEHEENFKYSSENEPSAQSHMQSSAGILTGVQFPNFYTAALAYELQRQQHGNIMSAPMQDLHSYLSKMPLGLFQMQMSNGIAEKQMNSEMFMPLLAAQNGSLLKSSSVDDALSQQFKEKKENAEMAKMSSETNIDGDEMDNENEDDNDEDNDDYDEESDKEVKLNKSGGATYAHAHAHAHSKRSRQDNSEYTYGDSSETDGLNGSIQVTRSRNQLTEEN
jgi:hypothetical protein